MAAIEHCEHVELQSQHLSVVRTLQAVWRLLKLQRRYRRSLSELSRLDSRLLRDIGLEPPEISTEVGEWLPLGANNQRAGAGSRPPMRQVAATTDPPA
ncbi:DUF1127 domain-containing protein [Rhizobium sp. BK377]|uniref:DUF1127 domain-containing protein n=1 Tax=Rhizobium sp. BK377 TaxID=2587058 RepID=UPI0016103592|nr:uncharacterized protein YjiS (DUF1127 family) [Rhizobium sp. BK377]